MDTKNSNPKFTGKYRRFLYTFLFGAYEQYLSILETAGHYTRSIAGLFRELDRHIPDNTGKENCLGQEVIFKWDESLSCSPVTRKKKYAELRGFTSFLQSRGITCYIPETPRKPPGTYVPYIFDENEWNRIIMGADNLADSLKQTKTDMPNHIPDAGQDAVCVWSACVRSAFIKSR